MNGLIIKQPWIDMILSGQKTWEMRHWQKWHNKGITVNNGYAYPDGVAHEPRNSLYQVDWTEGAHECNN